MPRKASPKFDQKSLTKGQLRKLNALRKSVGDEIGTRAFAAWFPSSEIKGKKEPVDKNAEMVTGVLEALIKDKKLTIARGGYLLRRGRKRVIVTRAFGGPHGGGDGPEK